MNTEQTELRRIEKIIKMQDKKKRRIIEVIVLLVAAILILVLQAAVQENQRRNQESIIAKQKAELETQQDFIAKLQKENIDRETNILTLKGVDTVAYESKPEELKEDTSGFIFYNIPEVYKRTGGDLPEDIQKHIYNLCIKYNFEYSTALAMIETESEYKKEAVSPANAKGYMQVIEKYHKEKIKELGGDNADITDPYLNISVGIDYIAYLNNKYGNIDKALTAYCYGEAGAKKYVWDKGETSSNYSLKVLKKARRIKEELGGYSK